MVFFMPNISIIWIQPWPLFLFLCHCMMLDDDTVVIIIKKKKDYSDDHRKPQPQGTASVMRSGGLGILEGIPQHL